MKKNLNLVCLLLKQHRKKLIVMRNTVLILLISALQVFATGSYAQTKKISLAMKDAAIRDVLYAIQKQSEFYFLYNSELIDVTKKVDITIEEEKVDQVLTRLFNKNEVDFLIKDRYIVLTPVGGNAELFAEQQQPAVSGKVTDESGQPLPGVTIVIKGTTRGTVTNADGEYNLTNLPEDATLVFSFVGMRSHEVVVGNQTRINVRMEQETIGIEEVVAIGYGTQRKATLTGSVSGISNEEIMMTPSPNLSNSLAGLMPGLVAVNRSGQPGSDNSTFLVRGNSTTGNNTPLILVDGIAESGWERIDPNDIESISVLKDAAASIYGVQAANGVILITTKRGTAGKPVFNLSVNQAITQPTRVPEMASSATLAEYGNEFLTRMGDDPIWTNEQIQKFRDGSDPINYPNTNWVEESFKKFALQESANLNIRGGSDNILYSVSGSYQHQDDILKDGIHDYKNYAIRTNTDMDVSKDIRISLDLNFKKDDRVIPMAGGVSRIYQTNPQYPVYWPGGYPSNPPSDYGYHPMINNTGGSGYLKSNGFYFTGKASIDIKIPWVAGLGIDGYYAYNHYYNRGKNWTTPWTYYGWDKENEKVIPLGGGTVAKPTLEENFSHNHYNLVNLRIKYEKQFTDHYVSVFLAGEQSKGLSDNFRAYREGFLTDAIEELFAGSANNMQTDGISSNNARQNIFGRLNYNYQEKYLLDFNFRYDGSYKFPKDNRWGFFPGVSVAWRLSEESFFQSDFFDNLKIRASYGEMGNDAIDAFQFLQAYKLSSLGYFVGRPINTVPGVYPGVSPNPNVTWEVATNQNIGLDFQIIDNLFGFTFDVFKQRRSNILTTRALELPDYTGLTLPAENIGIVDNKGFEIELTHRNSLSVGSGLSYHMKGNFALARNNVVDVSEAEDVPEYQKAEGHILGARLYYEATGIFRTQEQVDSNPIYPGTIVGDLQYKDVNNDGLITAADRVRMDKSIIPEITFGYNLSVQYDNFSLFAHFAGQARAWWAIFQNARVSMNAPEELLENRYTTGSMDSKYPWIPQMEGFGREVSGLESTFWLQNASFLRLKTLELSYQLPKDFISRFNVGSMRVYLNGNNLLTFSKIKWYDPEGDNTTGAFYPQSKIYNVGIQILF